MGAPSPELCKPLAGAGLQCDGCGGRNRHVSPDSSIVEVDQVHGSATVARGADGIRKTMAAYIDMKPHMDVVTHHTTISRPLCAGSSTRR